MSMPICRQYHVNQGFTWKSISIIVRTKVNVTLKIYIFSIRRTNIHFSLQVSEKLRHFSRKRGVLPKNDRVKVLKSKIKQNLTQQNMLTQKLQNLKSVGGGGWGFVLHYMDFNSSGRWGRGCCSSLSTTYICTTLANLRMFRNQPWLAEWLHGFISSYILTIQYPYKSMCADGQYILRAL